MFLTSFFLDFFFSFLPRAVAFETAAGFLFCIFEITKPLAPAK